jgi:alpha-amylase
MASVCFYFQVHQPFRLRRYSVFDTDHIYFDDVRNADICRKVAHKCYLPTTRLLLRLLRAHPEFKIAFSFTGTILDQFEAFAPELVDLLKSLVGTGQVEVLAETYHHSLSFIYSKREFAEQVGLHGSRIEGLFGVAPRVFRNTELIYSDAVAEAAKSLGMAGIVAEGSDLALAGRSPNAPFVAPCGLPVLLRNYPLSDDIAFRFSNRAWPGWPLTADKFAEWISNQGGSANVDLFMDFETFGEHQWAETGIFGFLEHLPAELLAKGNTFAKPSEALARGAAAPAQITVPALTSWADTERDTSAWLGNAMQSNALHELYKLEPAVKATGDEILLEDWRRLTTSDHAYYMSTKFFADGAVHKYFNPYESPYDAYINYMNVLDNIATRAGATGR